MCNFYIYLSIYLSSYLSIYPSLSLSLDLTPPTIARGSYLFLGRVKKTQQPLFVDSEKTKI